MTGTLWLWLLLAFVAGGVVGLLVARGRHRNSGEARQLERLQGELDSYREEVTEHFVKTAHLVNELTHSYKAVYDHLEKGAYTLVGSETLHRRLEKVEAEPVMLEYLGQRKAIAHAPQEHAAAPNPEPALASVEPAQDEAEEKREEAKASAKDTADTADTNESKKALEREPERVAG